MEGRDADATLEEDEEPVEKEEQEVEEGGCFLFLARGDLCARNRAPSLEMKRREEKG